MANKKNAKDDAEIKFTDQDEKEWIKMIQPNTQKFIDSPLVSTESYNLKNVFLNPSNDFASKSSTFKEEIISSKLISETDFECILKKAKSIQQSKEVKEKFLAVQGAGFYADIKKGDSLKAEHVIAILLYNHFPKFVALYRSDVSKFYNFHRCLYEIVTYFGQPMPKDMIVYVGVSGPPNEDMNDQKDDGKRRNDNWEFFNTAFLVSPFSACKEQNVFAKGTLVVSLKAQFLNEFNDTNYFDLSSFSSFAEKDGKNEVLFMGQFSELSIVNMSVKDDDKYEFTEYFRALNHWQKLTSGFADFNSKKYNIEPMTEETQKALLDMLNGDKKVPNFIQRVFKYYNESKKGEPFHRMYTELLDVGFDKFCKKERVRKEIAALLIKDDGTDVDPNKIKKIFKNAQKYVNTKEKKMVFL